MKKFICMLTLFGLVSMSQAQVITTGNGTGPIPDDDPSGLIVTFPVTGMTAPIKSISLQLTMDHTYIGDLTVRLQAPNGIASTVIFGRTGYKKDSFAGASVNMNGTYFFNDMADNDWWQTALPQGTSFIMPTGAYRSSTLAPYNANLDKVLSNYGGCTTRMDGAFAGLSASQGNGNWILSATDFVGQDTGSITAALLVINEQTNIDLIFADGFDGPTFANFSILPASDLLGDCKKTRFDFSGNGLADYTILEDNGSAEILWTIQENDGTTTGAIQAFILGIPATDFIMEGDIDGDGIKDPIVWRSAPNGSQAYYVRRSSRPDDDILKFEMGQASDVAAQIGDYDGDGIEDFALFRAPSSAGPTKLIIHQSSTGTFRDIDMISGTFFSVFSTSGYDHTGDGIADAVVQRTSTINAGVGEHLIYDGSNGNFFTSFEFGNNTDLLAPGNYLGDDRADISLGRLISGDRNWFSRETGPGTEIGPTVLGVSGNFMLTGDYDGDGFDDYAVYDSNPGEFKFIIRPSSDPGTPIEVSLGSAGIYPIANSRVQ